MSTFGERLRFAREKKKLKQWQLAKRCSWGEGEKASSRISNYENGLRQPRPRDVEKLATVLGISKAWLQFGMGSMIEGEEEESNEASGISGSSYQCAEDNPYYSTEKSRLYPLLAIDQIDGWLANPTLTAQQTTYAHIEEDVGMNAFFLVVTSDAMQSNSSSTIPEGDMVLVDPDHKPESGDIVLAKVDNAYMLRQYKQDLGATVLKALNPQYPTISVDERVTIAGVVIIRLRRIKN